MTISHTAAQTFTCCGTPIPWPARGRNETCPDCGTVWEHDGVDLGAGARIKNQPPDAAAVADPLAIAANRIGDPEPSKDYRIMAARRALAELPEASGNERPLFWVGRLRVHVQALADGWPAGVPGGLDYGQREVTGQALADALDYRTPSGDCADCDTRPEGLCCDHAADLDLTDAYLALGRELGSR